MYHFTLKIKQKKKDLTIIRVATETTYLVTKISGVTKVTKNIWSLI